ncbi:MAG: hypothetical protein AB8I08_00495 [Sandaracinaceae bacterium]
MTRPLFRALSILLVPTLAFATACGGDDETEEVVDETPIVGLYEMAISRNNQGSAPSDAALIEISPTALQVDHRPIAELNRGRPADSEVGDDIITPLLTRLRGAPARSRVAIKLHATVPYLTMVQVLNTVQEAGIHEAHFAVRTLGDTPSEGWMPLRQWRVVPHEGEIEWATRALPWSAFSEHWREVYAACRAGEYIDCDAPYANIAEGGELEMELWTRGQGMKVTFRQVNAPEPEAGGGGGGGGVALIEGLAPAPAAAPAEEEAPPATVGAFNVRHQESTLEDSALSNQVAPVCANQACRAVVVADATGQSMRIVSLIGGVFANGFSEGEIAFRLPER